MGVIEAVDALKEGTDNGLAGCLNIPPDQCWHSVASQLDETSVSALQA